MGCFAENASTIVGISKVAGPLEVALLRQSMPVLASNESTRIVIPAKVVKVDWLNHSSFRAPFITRSHARSMFLFVIGTKF